MKRWHWMGFLTILWLALTSSLALPNIILGIILAAIVVMIAIYEQPGDQTIKINLLFIIPFLCFMLKEMFWANLKIIIDIFNPFPQHNPGIIRFTPSCNKDYQRVWLANMISLIPGTLTIDTDSGADHLYIHVMFLNDKHQTLEELRLVEQQVIRMLP